MLTDIAIKKAKPLDKDYKLSDSQGLYILIRKNGSKLWRFKYRFGGKEKLLAIGTYPNISLAEARNTRDNAKRDINHGIDPSFAKAQQKRLQYANIDNSFQGVAQKWFDLNKGRWVEVHANGVWNSLEKRIFPDIGKLNIKDIDTPFLLWVIQKIEKTGAIETAHRIRQRVEAVFNYAISVGLIDSNPAKVLSGALKRVPKKEKQPAIINLADLKIMMEKASLQPGQPVTKLALHLLSLTFVRPGELRTMLWDEIDGDVWFIPAERMKMKKPHMVLLSRQALYILNEVKKFTGGSPFVFPNTRSIEKPVALQNPLSENAIGYLLNRAGYKGIHVPHGFRAAFSSIMNERYPQDRMVIDLMLAHENKNTVEAAYNRAEHLERRKELYQIWADLLTEGALPINEMLKIAKC